VLGQAGMAQLPAQEQLPGERRVQALPGKKDGVALGHASTVTRLPVGRAGTVWRRGEEVA